MALRRKTTSAPHRTPSHYLFFLRVCTFFSQHLRRSVATEVKEAEESLTPQQQQELAAATAANNAQDKSTLTQQQLHSRQFIASEQA